MRGSTAIIGILILLSGILIFPVTAQDDDCPLPVRLTKGDSGLVSAGREINLRGERPGGPRIGRLTEATRFYVADGPFCQDGLNWWQVKNSRLSGYAAEGQGDIYYLEPYVFQPPDGDSWIAFQSERNIIEAVDPTGENRRDLTTRFAADPGLSPDGTAITFTRTVASRWDVYVYYMEKDALLRLTYGGRSEGPAWSPDGTQVIYSTADTKGDLELFAYDLKTNLERQITPTDTAIAPLMPTWSPDGGQILFVNANGSALYSIDSDGENLRQLTDYAVRSPDWSPDGAHIAFVQTGAPDSTVNQLQVMNLKSGDVQTMLEGTEYYDPPAWSPDGASLVYSLDNNLYVIDADGSTEPRLLVENGFTPDWGTAAPA
jgi:Tol biopolymer transport system component